jgi:primase-polymerase (primpol)-like protein
MSDRPDVALVDVFARGSSHQEAEGVRASFSGDLAALPAAVRPLTEHRRWVVWRWWRKNPDSKWTKRPHQVEAPNAHALSNKPSTWSSHAAAVTAVKAGKADGIGYILTDSGIGAIDLDKCRDPYSGEITTWAQELIDETDSYVEAIVSGTGLRIIGLVEGADLHTEAKAPDGGEIEFYRRATQFITVSGLQIGDCAELQNIDELIDRTYEKFTREAPPQRRSKARSPRRREKPIPSCLTSSSMCRRST